MFRETELEKPEELSSVAVVLEATESSRSKQPPQISGGGVVDDRYLLLLRE